MSNCKVLFLNEAREPITSENQVGELYVGGACLAKGYFNLKNDDKFVELNGERYFKTGDFGYVKNSLIYFTGRVDSQLKINGKKVSLNDLVCNAVKIEGIEQFIPLVCDFNNANKIIIAYYKTTIQNQTESEINEMIKSKLKEVLYDYMLPTFLMRLDTVPLLYNGKVDKQLLIRRFKADFELKSSLKMVEANLSESSQKLLKIMSKLTGITAESFISNNCKKCLSEYGVNSLNSIEIYLNLCDEIENLRFYLSLDDFISSKSLNELMDKLENRSKLVNGEKNQDIDTVACFDRTLNIDHSNLKVIQVKIKELRFAKKILKLISDTYPLKSILLKNTLDMRTMFDVHYNFMAYAHRNSDSFLVYDKTKQKCVGGVFIYDFFQFEHLHFPKRKLQSLSVEILHQIFGPIEAKYAERFRSENKRVLKSGMATTNLDCTFNENVAIIDFIESEIVANATRNGYDCILALNANKLTTVKQTYAVICCFE
jgi:hypothetical protein